MIPSRLVHIFPDNFEGALVIIAEVHQPELLKGIAREDIINLKVIKHVKVSRPWQYAQKERADDENSLNIR